MLEDLQGGGEGVFRGLVGEEMDVLRHEDVGGYTETLLPAGLFEDLLNGVFCCGGVEEGLTLVATEGDEVEVVGLLVTFEAGGHGGTSSLHSHPSQKREGWGTRAFGVGLDVRVRHPAPGPPMIRFPWRKRRSMALFCLGM